MTAAEKRVFEGIARAWSLSTDERRALLGDGAAEQSDRLALVAQCYDAAHLLLPIEDRAHAWFRRPNSALGGETALAVMTATPDGLGRVKRYLLAETV